MIGTNLRSIRHLWRVCDETLTPIMVNTREFNHMIWFAVKLKNSSRFGECLVLFNNQYRNDYASFDTYIHSEEIKPFAAEIISQGCSRAYTITKNSLNKSRDLSFSEIILLPKTFFRDYETFLKTNSKMIENLKNKYGINPINIIQQRLYIYSDGSKNFFPWAVGMIYGQNINLNIIRNILLWNDLYGQLVKNLSKGTITAYTTSDSINVLMKELTILRRGKRMSDAINSFNTVQKKLLKTNELSELDKETLSKFSKLSETKRINFIKKVSSIDNFDELMRQMRHVCSVHFAWNKASFNDFLENVEGLNYKKVFENENIVLVEVNDYDTIKQLAKTTNWCISKNKSYWNNYVECDKMNIKQYLIFDFSRTEDDNLSIVGFTTRHNKGITHAHDFTNNNLMSGNPRINVSLIKSYISKFINTNNIYSILAHDGIDINIVANYDEPLYKWDKESVMQYLYECVNQENVDILSSDKDKMALSVKDENIKYFLGDTYCDNIPEEYFSYQHIIFLDFSRSKYDISKLQFAIIGNNGYDEDYCQCLYNERSLNEGDNFEIKLAEYNLPYDIIRRTDNIKVKMRNAITSYNVPMTKDCMKQCTKQDFLTVIRDYVYEDTFNELLISSVRDFMSFDYLDLIYDNGMTISQVLGVKRASDFCRHIFQTVLTCDRDLALHLQAPSDKDIEDFYSEKITNKNYAKYVGAYLAINKVIENEKGLTSKDDTYFAKSIFRTFIQRSLKGSIMDNFMIGLMKHVDFSTIDDTVISWMKYAINQGGEEIKALAKKKADESKEANSIYNKLIGEQKEINKVTAQSVYTTITSNAGINSVYAFNQLL